MFDSKKKGGIVYREVVFLKLSNGRIPFEAWLFGLTSNMQVVVDARISRLMKGNLGDHKYLGEGIYELRIHYGPGLRIYYARMDELIILICGGDKSSQKRDINWAIRIWKLYENENSKL